VSRSSHAGPRSKPGPALRSCKDCFVPSVLILLRHIAICTGHVENTASKLLHFLRVTKLLPSNGRVCRAVAQQRLSLPHATLNTSIRRNPCVRSRSDCIPLIIQQIYCIYRSFFKNRYSLYCSRNKSLFWNRRVQAMIKNVSI
jgi:hypothetical protein